MNRLRIPLAIALSLLPLSSALACGGDFSTLDMSIMTVQSRMSSSPRQSARMIRAQALARVR